MLDNVRDLTIVVVGILVALWAEGEWQKRQEIALVNHALAQIARGLEHDIEDMVVVDSDGVLLGAVSLTAVLKALRDANRRTRG